jgi:hypothetical protein
LLICVSLPRNSAFALFDLSRLPGSIEVMQGDQAFLDVGAGAHFLGTADQHTHRTIPYFLEEGLFLGVGFGVADGGDLLGRNAGSD